MPDIPNLLRIVDSTANGATGFFYDTYSDAVTFEQRKAGILGNGWIRVFEAWWQSPLRSVTVTVAAVTDIEATLTDRERAGIERWQWTPGQIQWRRETIATKCGGDEGRFDQEYPESEDVAFRASGSPRFNVALVGKMFARAEAAEKARQTGKPGAPVLGHIVDAANGIIFMPDQTAPWLWMAEAPIPGCRYLLPIDPMTGAQSTGAKVRDRHAACILRLAYADRAGQIIPATVAAVLYARDGECQWEMDVLADRTKLLAKLYGDCLVVPEVNKAMDLIPLLRAAGCRHLYRRPVRPDDSNPSEKQSAVGFLTTSNTRNLWVNALSEGIREQAFECLYLPAITDFANMIVNSDGRAEAAPKKHDDWCFVAGTRILTPNGEVPIESLRTGDLVTTRNGPRRVLGCLSRLASVVSNLGLVGTANHPVITPSGEVDLAMLNDDDILYIWNSSKQTVEKRSFTEAKNTTDTLCRSIGNCGSISGGMTNGMSRLSHFTGSCGLIFMDQFQKAMLFITRMTTRSITRLETLFSCLKEGIKDYTWPILNESAFALKTDGVPRRSGGRDLTDGSPRYRQKNGRHGSKREGEMSPMFRNENWPALVAERFSDPLSEGRNTARKAATLGSRTARRMQKRRVFNLQVEDSPEYFANGILVHNCAAIGIGLLTQGGATMLAPVVNPFMQGATSTGVLGPWS